MNIRVIDFDILTRNFQHYADGYLKIESKKREILTQIEPIKNEMNSIIKSASSGLIMDEMTKRTNEERFRTLQEKLMGIDQEAKKTLKEMQEELTESTFQKLSEIVSDWSKENSIDLVMGKMEVIFSSEAVDATDDILQIIKDKGLQYVPEEPTVVGEAIQPQP